MMNNFFEKILWNSKLTVLLAVIASLLLSLFLFVITSWDVLQIIIHISDYFTNDSEARSILKKDIIAHTVGSIDGFLLATILLIFSLGLYELFINDININNDDSRAKVLIIKSLDDLKSKLAKVILMILVVTFFEISLTMTFANSLELLYFSLGILGVSAALYLSNKK